MIQAMRCHKRRMTEGFEYQNEFVRGRIGIVADPPGSGKTLAILGFLGLPDLTSPTQGPLNSHSNRNFVSYELPRLQDSSAIHVVIVPTHLLNQWQKEVEKTTLRPLVISNRRLLRNTSTLSALMQSDFILTTNRVWKDVYQYTQQQNIYWKNLFIDEATSIYLSPHDGIPMFGFMWLITSNWQSLQHRNQHLHIDTNWFFCTTESSSFYRNLIPWTHPLRHVLVLKSEEPIPYPPLSKVDIKCRQPYTLLNLPTTLLGTNYGGLVPHKMPTIFNALGMGSYTIDSIKQLFGRPELIDAKADDDCSICLEEPQHCVILPCCMHRFCGSCILRQLIMSGQCPLCRVPLTLSDLHPLRQDSSQNEVLMTKQDTCFQYVQENQEKGHFLIYTTYENTYYQLQQRFADIGLRSDLLELNSQHSTKTIANFNNGSIKILFITNMDAVRGLTLSKATHLILFYAVPSYEREQILIHSMQRLGSKELKTVVQLSTALDE